MAGLLLLRRAHSSLSFGTGKKVESGSTQQAEQSKRPYIPERSLSESSVPQIKCTVGPSELRSAINPNWRSTTNSTTNQQGKKNRNIHQLRLNTLSNTKKLVQAQEHLDSVSKYQFEDDLEVPFELDENLSSSNTPSISPSPAHSLLNTPIFPYSPTSSMKPLDFSTSFSSTCHCDVECIDPSLCHTSFVSVGSSSSYRLNKISSGPSTASSSKQTQTTRFIHSPIYEQSEGDYFNQHHKEHEQIRQAQIAEDNQPCSWENSPQSNTLSNHNSLSNSLNSSSSFLPNSYSITSAVYARNTESRRESQDSTYNNSYSDNESDTIHFTEKSSDLNDILNGCGSLIDTDNNGGFLRSTTSTSLASSSSSLSSSLSMNTTSASALKGLNIKNVNNLSTFTLSPVLEREKQKKIQAKKQQDLNQTSPRSNENTIKSIGFNIIQPNHNQYNQSRLSIQSPPSSLSRSRRLFTIKESD
ncbi:uncharacterized protein L201_000683 [Kwoniella dendrophila CBS 6074]|uniref:Ig-like domain-containing protein n=1 Tax=Kwoniella dendrophila CBS 6074 TaxID=1295534 RepID=A0AAX4JK80_9TREE